MNVLHKAYHWFDRLFSLTQPGVHWIPQTTYVNRTVDETSAMQVSVVWACVRLLAETVASLPLSIFEETREGNSRKLPEDPLSILLHHRPNMDMTSVEFREAMMLNLTLHGNAYALKGGNGGKVTALYPMSATSMVAQRKDNGDVLYRYSDRGKIEEYPPEKIFHLKGFGSDGLMGLSPIAFARQAMGLSMATEEYGSRFFAQGARPSAVLKVPQGVSLDDKQRARAKEVFENMHSGLENSHKLFLLEHGFDYQIVSIPPEDAQFLETRKFQLNEICRIFRVPPHMVADLDRATFSNIENQGLEFEKFTLRPYLTRWEQAIWKSLLTPTERATKYARFNLDGLLRADSGARANYYSVMLQNGVMTRNEVRALENLNRVDGADELTVQVNLSPLDQLGAAIQNPKPNGALAFTAPAKADVELIHLKHEMKQLVKVVELLGAKPASINVAPPAVTVHTPEIKVDLQIPKDAAPRKLARKSRVERDELSGQIKTIHTTFEPEAPSTSEVH